MATIIGLASAMVNAYIALDAGPVWVRAISAVLALYSIGIALREDDK